MADDAHRTCNIHSIINDINLTELYYLVKKLHNSELKKNHPNLSYLHINLAFGTGRHIRSHNSKCARSRNVYPSNCPQKSFLQLSKQRFLL